MEERIKQIKESVDSIINYQYVTNIWQSCEIRARHNENDIYKYSVIISVMNLILCFFQNHEMVLIIIATITITLIFIEHNLSIYLNGYIVSQCYEYENCLNSFKYKLLNAICKNIRFSVSALAVSQTIFLAIIIILKSTIN